MKVIKIITAQAIPGMVVAENVYTKDDHLIIAKETTLTDRLITRLEFYSVLDLSVYSDIDETESEKAFVADTYYEKIRSSESFIRFQLAYVTTTDNLKDKINGIVTDKKEINPEPLISEINSIIHRCNSNIELIDMLHCMRNYDDTTYIHSINVALICNIIGKWLNFNENDLETITLCGLLHDLGKLMMPADIITKPAKLTEEEYNIIKTHPMRGYNILKAKKLDPRIKHAALMHHERCDGSGYPYGFHSEQIDPFAKLVAIADVYDAMTCARVYRGPLCPFEVISLFETEGYTKYDSKYITTFLNGIVQTYINNNVRLSNQQTGEIIMINKMNLSKPIIKSGDEFIDLSKRRDLYIEAMI